MSEPINYKTRLWRIMGPGPMQPLGDRLGRQNSVCVVRGEGAGRGREQGGGEGAGREGAGRGGAGDTQIDLERWQINQSFAQLRSM